VFFFFFFRIHIFLLMSFGGFRFILSAFLFFSNLVFASRDERLMGTAAAPIDDQGLADAEQHDGDLSDGEEAPDGGLFHQVGGDEAGEVGAEREKEYSLDNHPFLFVQGKERGEHQKRMDGGARNQIRLIGHGHRPGKMIISSECTDFVTSQPFCRRADESLGPHL